MPTNLSRSLIFRVGVAMAGITLLAIFAMVGSVIIADTARGDAAAINLAGSLRMRAYLIGTHIQNPDTARVADLLARDSTAFDRSLHDRTLSSVISNATDNPVAESYRRVIVHWDQHLKPDVEVFAADPQTSRARYLAEVDRFVAEVDHLVHQLQQDAEGKIQLLRLVQGGALFLTLALVFFTMSKLTLDVIPPLRDLLDAVADARRGDLSTRTTYCAQDELGLLSRTFNEMAESLSGMYAELEQRVADRTAELQQSNLSLEMLYETANRLGRADASDTAAYRPILQRLEQITGLGPITLCLTHPGQGSSYSQVSAHRRRPNHCQAPNCAACFEAACHGTAIGASFNADISPIAEKEQRFGVLVVERYEQVPVPWQRNLIEAVAAHIATSCSLAQQAEQHRRLALIEERTVIARELHDSLAQSLSYLKIQVARLQKLGDIRGTANEILIDLREGLNAAYRQLRELLTTFRLQMDEPGLEPALQKTVGEFAGRAGIDITLEYGLGNCPLTPNEEIHVLQIVREALANVDHHAHASHAEVRLLPESDGTVSVYIEDDGVGIDRGDERQHHYGLRIMEERAQGLGGWLELQGRGTGGTVLHLRFRSQRLSLAEEEGAGNE